MILELSLKPAGTWVRPRTHCSSRAGGTAVAAGAKKVACWNTAVEPSKRFRSSIWRSCFLRAWASASSSAAEYSALIASDSAAVIVAVGDEFLAENGGGRRVRGDLAVEQGLGEGRLVGLVVAVAAVADHVDHDVALEFWRNSRASSAT